MTTIDYVNQDRVVQLANEITRRTNARKDYVTGRENLGVTLAETGTEGSQSLALTLKNGADHVLGFKRSALQQLATTLSVPMTYLDRLVEAGHTDLAAANLSELLSRETRTEKGQARRQLVRTLDGQVDAILSDRYRAISHDDVLAVVLQEFEAVGAKVWDLRLTDTQFRVIGLHPAMHGEIVHALSADSGAHAWWKAGEGKGDTHHAAVTIKNSETGHGLFSGDIALWRAYCRNTAVVSKGVAQVHIGKRMAEGEHVVTSEATRSLEDQALVSKLRDVIRTAFDPIKFKALLDSVSATTARTLGEVSATEVVDASVKVFGLPQERKEAILETLLKSGLKSQFGLAQAITAQANPDEQNKGTQDEARNAFEDAGGKILTQTESQWKAFLRGAWKPSDVAEKELAGA